MKELETSLGVAWCTVEEREQRVWTPAEGAFRTPLRFTYSMTGPLHIELLQGQPGTIWDAGDGEGLHHTGVWSENVRSETDALVSSGWTLLAAQLGPEDGYGMMTYVRSPWGFVLELVNVTVRPMFERWWAGAPLA